MENEKGYFINEVWLKGQIINIYPATESKNCVIVTLDVGNKTFPKIVCFQHNAEIVWQRYYIGDTITMLANMQSSFNKGHKKVTVSLFCTKIVDNTEIRTPTYNQFLVKGQVVSCVINEKNRVMSVILRTEVDNRVSTFPITIYNMDLRINDYMENQTLEIRGRVETVRKQHSDGNRSYYQNYVAEQIKDYF